MARATQQAMMPARMMTRRRSLPAIRGWTGYSMAASARRSSARSCGLIRLSSASSITRNTSLPGNYPEGSAVSHPGRYSAQPRKPRPGRPAPNRRRRTRSVTLGSVTGELIYAQARTRGTAIPYLEAWELQRRLHDLRASDEIPDTCLLLEHEPV